MCRAATCKHCDRPTWKGCGMHVEQVLGDVPKRDRCQCGSGRPATTRAAGVTAPPKKRWFSRG
jgi:hypothetical protein